MLDKFKEYLSQNGSSTNTQKVYLCNVKKYLNEYPSILTRQDVLEYKEHLQNDKGLSAKSINQMLSSLKSYNEFLIEKNIQDNMVIISKDFIKIQKSLINPTIASLRDVSIFMNKIRNSNDKYSFRNYAIAMTIANTGLRISEICKLKIKNLSLDDNEAVIIGKGNKQRDIIVYPEAVKIIKEYLKIRNSDSPYLFVSQKGDRLQTSTIQRIFKNNSDTITPHQLRHVFATNFLNECKDIAKLQLQLGHSDPRTTMIYNHPTKKDRKKDLDLIKIK